LRKNAPENARCDCPAAENPLYFWLLLFGAHLT
jgi:hypothetical protein